MCLLNSKVATREEEEKKKCGIMKIVKFQGKNVCF